MAEFNVPAQDVINKLAARLTRSDVEAAQFDAALEAEQAKTALLQARVATLEAKIAELEGATSGQKTDNRASRPARTSER